MCHSLLWIGKTYRVFHGTVHNYFPLHIAWSMLEIHPMGEPSRFVNRVMPLRVVPIGLSIYDIKYTSLPLLYDSSRGLEILSTFH